MLLVHVTGLASDGVFTPSVVAHPKAVLRRLLFTLSVANCEISWLPFHLL